MQDNTVVSGSASNSSHDQISCGFCNKANPFGMRFCLSCGRPALYSQMTQQAAPNCLRCGCNDPLNQAFCIACGSDLPLTAQSAQVNDLLRPKTKTAIAVRHKTGFSWSVEPVEVTTNIDAKLKTEIKQEVKQGNVPRKKSARNPAGVVSALAGTILGCGIASMLTSTPFAKYAAERAHWPSQGVVVYAKPKGAKVVLENVNTRAITMGQIDDKGGLILRNVAPGDYRLFLQSYGAERAFTELNVLPNRPTIVGFPTPIVLSLDSH